jgi:hypothetical protein
MSIDLEYAIRKDIRNNPVIRELDTRERREIRRTIWLAVLSVALLLFAAWQNQKMVQHGMDMERWRAELAYEARANRWLQLNLETLRAPKEIEKRARDLGMVPAPAADTLVIERAPAPAPRGGVIAQVN